MSAVRDLTQAGTTEVAFEVERVGWPSPDRLEVVGRWFGVRGRRFIRPTLKVDVEGQSRRMLAVLDHKPWAVEDGQEWVAAFAWQGDPVDLTGSELTVGPGHRSRAPVTGREREPGRRSFARPPRADVLESELAAAREKTRRSSVASSMRRERTMPPSWFEPRPSTRRSSSACGRGRDAGQDAEHRAAELHGELDNARDRLPRLETALRKARNELAVARADLAAQREGLERERAAVAAEATKAAADEMERLRQERDAARRKSAKPAPSATSPAASPPARAASGTRRYATVTAPAGNVRSSSPACRSEGEKRQRPRRRHPRRATPSAGTGPL